MPFQKIYFNGSAYMVDPTIAEMICNLQSVSDMSDDNAVIDSMEVKIDGIIHDAIYALNAYKIEEKEVA